MDKLQKQNYFISATTYLDLPGTTGRSPNIADLARKATFYSVDLAQRLRELLGKL